MTLGLSIPLFNEAALVTEVVVSIHAALKAASVPATLVLVNNGSTDDTGACIDELRIAGEIEAIHLRENLGYGGGILSGLAHLEAQGLPDVIGWCWGDGQVRPRLLAELYGEILAGADLAKVHRTERRDGLARQAVTAVYSATMALSGVREPDVNGCPKLMTRACFEAIQPRSADWFLDAEVVLRAERLGMSIARRPAVMHPRRAGESKVKLGTIAEFAINLARWHARR